jgi:hypothetical protein
MATALTSVSTDLFTASEIAVALGVGATRVRNALQGMGAIPERRAGTTRLFSASVIEAVRERLSVIEARRLAAKTSAGVNS